MKSPKTVALMKIKKKKSDKKRRRASKTKARKEEEEEVNSAYESNNEIVVKIQRKKNKSRTKSQRKKRDSNPKTKKPKCFLEVGVFHGVTARNVCELLYQIHGDEFRYIGLDIFEKNDENKSESNRMRRTTCAVHISIIFHFFNIL